MMNIGLCLKYFRMTNLRSNSVKAKDKSTAAALEKKLNIDSINLELAKVFLCFCVCLMHIVFALICVTVQRV